MPTALAVFLSSGSPGFTVSQAFSSYLHWQESDDTSSLDIFIVEGPVFTQISERPCSKAATWCASAFAHGVPAAFLRERHAGSLAPCMVLVVQITTFLHLVEEWVLPFCSWRLETLGQAWWKPFDLFAQWGSRAPGIHTVVDGGILHVARTMKPVGWEVGVLTCKLFWHIAYCFCLWVGRQLCLSIMDVFWVPWHSPSLRLLGSRIQEDVVNSSQSCLISSPFYSLSFPKAESLYVV
jgi:hypothetical protein